MSELMNFEETHVSYDIDDDDDEDAFLPPGFIPGETVVAVFCPRKEFLRRSISSLDNDDILDPKDDIRNDENPTAQLDDPPMASTRVNDRLGGDLLTLKLDALAADLEAEVVAGNLFMESIKSPTSGMSHSLDVLLPDSVQLMATERIVYEQKISILVEELEEARRDATEQRERVAGLENELQQLALTGFTERQSLLDRIREQEDDFIRAMTSATWEIEQLQAAHSKVLNHVKEQYQLVEEELLDALEREDELKEEQETILAECNEKFANFEQCITAKLAEATLESELQKEQSFMERVDWFRSCSLYLKQKYDEDLDSVKKDLILSQNELHETHVADMVHLFRSYLTTMPESGNQINPVNAKVPETVHEELPSQPVSCSQVDATSAAKRNVHETLLTAVAAIQSPTSAFEVYSNSSKTRDSLVEHGDPTTIETPLELVADSTDDVESSQDAPNMERVPTTASPIQRRELSRKSLDFSTPKAQKHDVKETNVDTQNHSVKHTPKIYAAKAKLRSIEASLSAQKQATNTISGSRGKAAGTDRTQSVPVVGISKVPTVKNIKSRLTQPTRRTGESSLPISCKQRVVELKKQPFASKTNLLSESGSITRSLGTTVTKSDTGVSNASNMSTVRGVQKKIPLSHDPKTLHAAPKQKSQLPQFNKSRLTSIAAPKARRQDKLLSSAQPSHDPDESELFKKLDDLTATSATPLTSRSAKCDRILTAGQVIASPTHRFNEVHFTPLKILDRDVLGSISPESPLVTPGIVRRQQVRKGIERAASPPGNAPRTRKPQNDAADRIQAVFRGYLARRDTKRVTLIACAQKIQSHARRMFAMRVLAKMRAQTGAAATRIQTVWRMKQSRTTFVTTIRMAKIIQCNARRMLAMRALAKSLAKIGTAATRIQTVWRMKQSQKTFVTTIRMVKIIQCNVRRMLAMRALAKSLAKIGAAATRSQTVWRMKQCRETFVKKRHLAQIVQSYTRRKVAMKILAKRRTQIEAAATQIQSLLRMKHCRENFAKKRHLAQILQSHARRKVAMKILAQRRTQIGIAATQIQSLLRMKQCRETFGKKRHLAQILQSHARRRFVMRVLAKRRMQIGIAATQIQSLLRMKQCRENFGKKRHLAQIIQCNVRRMLAMRVLAQRRTQIEAAATQIQSLRRMKHCRETFVKKRHLAQIVQSYARRKVAMKILAARRTQIEAAATQIQSLRRMKHCRETFVKKRHLAQIVQSYARQKVAMKILAARRTQIEAAATQIQSLRRMKHCRETFVKKRHLAQIVQSYARRKVAMSVLAKMRSEIQFETAATQIQTLWRTKQSHHAFVNAICMVRIIQSYSRRMLAMNVLVKLREETTVAATKVQNQWRMKQRRNAFAKAICMARIIQSYVRRMFARNLFIKMRSEIESAATQIQTFWRMKQQHNSFVTTIGMARIVQSYARRMLAKNYFMTMRSEIETKYLIKSEAAATCIQSLGRMNQSRNAFVTTICKVRIIQSKVRRMLAKRILVQFRKEQAAAATQIQTFWRMQQRQNSYAKATHSVRIIQSYARRLLAKNYLIKIYMEIGSTATQIQTLWRMKQNRKAFVKTIRFVQIIQSNARRMLAMKIRRKMHMKIVAAATQIQTRWRMKHCRNTFVQTKRMARIIQTSARRMLAKNTLIKLRFEASAPIKTSRKPFSDISDTSMKKSADRSLRSKNMPSQHAAGENVPMTTNHKTNRSVIAAEGLSTALKRAALSATQLCEGEMSALREEIEKLKVVDLRQELKSRGVPSKEYNKLRKAELITVVLQHRGFAQQS
jgi:IQ calmodulin-binding motif